MNWKRIVIITLFDLSHSIFRLKGLVFLIPFLLFWYLALKFLYDNGGELLTSAESLLFFSWLLRADIAQKLIILHPPTLSVFFIITLATIPFFAMLSGNDQTAGDSGRQSFRYFLTRCTRAEIFTGRLLGHYLMLALASFFTVIVAVVISIMNDQFSTVEILEYALQVFLLILIYMLPFVAFMSFISAMMSSALSALLMSFTVYILFLITGTYIAAKTSLPVSLIPSGVKDYLFNMNTGDLQTGIGGLIVYALVYISLGWTIFRMRNI